MSYDPYAILQSIDGNIVLFLILGSLAMTFNYIYFWAAAATTRRDRVYTFPLTCTTIWFAHDLSFVLLFNDWFDVYDHWYLKLFWVALIPTTLAEAYFIYQTWLYGKKELMPKASPAIFNAFMIVAIIFGLIVWYVIKQFLGDPIYAFTFGATGLIAPALVLGRILMRGDAKGQSITIWASYTGMQTCWLSATIIFFGDAFRTPQYLLMVAASIIGGIALAVITQRMSGTQAYPEQQPA